jgi:predicted RNA-binding Zn-ribbon protein involved in translation (DUF1610 family)
MGVIYCPECQQEVSEYAKACPHCGFGVSDFMQEHNLIDVENKPFVCPKCGEIHFGMSGWGALHVRCEYCGTIVKEISGETSDELFHKFCNRDRKNDTWDETEAEYAKKYGNNEFDINAFHERGRKTTERVNESIRKHNEERATRNLPKCPTCGSTNIEKISSSKRWFTTGLFGLGSSNVGKTMHCKNCGYKW